MASILFIKKKKIKKRVYTKCTRGLINLSKFETLVKINLILIITPEHVIPTWGGDLCHQGKLTILVHFFTEDRVLFREFQNGRSRVILIGNAFCSFRTIGNGISRREADALWPSLEVLVVSALHRPSCIYARYDSRP